MDKTKRSELIYLLEERILVLDGAMGTLIQSYNLNEEDFRSDKYANQNCDLKGNYDVLSQSRPDILKKIHKEYLDAGVKNDDLLIKMAALAQRAIQAEEAGISGGGLGLSEEEKEQLIAIAEEVKIQGDKTMNKGKIMVIPGLMNRILNIVIKFLPRILVTDIMYKIKKRKQER